MALNAFVEQWASLKMLVSSRRVSLLVTTYFLRVTCLSSLYWGEDKFGWGDGMTAAFLIILTLGIGAGAVLANRVIFARLGYARAVCAMLAVFAGAAVAIGVVKTSGACSSSSSLCVSPSTVVTCTAAVWRFGSRHPSILTTRAQRRRRRRRLPPPVSLSLALALPPARPPARAANRRNPRADAARLDGLGLLPGRHGRADARGAPQNGSQTDAR